MKYLICLCATRGCGAIEAEDGQIYTGLYGRDPVFHLCRTSLPSSSTCNKQSDTSRSSSIIVLFETSLPWEKVLGCLFAACQNFSELDAENHLEFMVDYESRKTWDWCPFSLVGRRTGQSGAEEPREWVLASQELRWEKKCRVRWTIKMISIPVAQVIDQISGKVLEFVGWTGLKLNNPDHAQYKAFLWNKGSKLETHGEDSEH